MTLLVIVTGIVAYITVMSFLVAYTVVAARLEAQRESHRKSAEGFSEIWIAFPEDVAKVENELFVGNCSSGDCEPMRKCEACTKSS